MLIKIFCRFYSRNVRRRVLDDLLLSPLFSLPSWWGDNLRSSLPSDRMQNICCWTTKKGFGVGVGCRGCEKKHMENAPHARANVCNAICLSLSLILCVCLTTKQIRYLSVYALFFLCMVLCLSLSIFLCLCLSVSPSFFSLSFCLLVFISLFFYISQSV